MSANLSKAKPDSLLFAAPNVIETTNSDGSILLECGYELPPQARCIGSWLVHWAETTPDAIFVAERRTDGKTWRRVTYAQALVQVLEFAGWIIEAGGTADRPVLILSENAVDHALLAQAAMYVGVPVATVSTAYSLLSKDFAKVKSMVKLLDPAIIYVSDQVTYGPALAAIAPFHDAEILTSKGAGQGSHLITEIARPDNSSEVSGANIKVGPDTVARLLFTSGSTGTPKAVINTQRMLTSNQEALRVLWPFLTKTPPVIVDWLPWSHTFGANFTSNMVLRNGGSQYIDNGKPMPAAIHQTVENMKEIRPNLCFNVPRGYDMLMQVMETDADLRDAFFDMDLMFNAAAALPETVSGRITEMSVAQTGRVLPIVAAWGATETAPMVTACHFLTDTSGNIGLPVPGCTLKLLPNSEKLEIRVKGPNITPGYFRNDVKTSEAFDAGGFYIMGDAVRFVDQDDSSKGLVFDGRVSEDFKLSSGTWVSVGAIRVAGIDALAPLAADIVVAGHDRDAPSFLIIPNEAACRALSGLPENAPLAEVLNSAAVRDKVAVSLADMRETRAGTSRHAFRARFLLDPMDQDKGEITDKAYLNQRQVLANRPADVAALYGDNPSEYIAIG